MAKTNDILAQLIEFVQYSKPYHTKLVDIGLDYFHDEPLKVKFKEQLHTYVDMTFDQHHLKYCPGGYDADEYGRVMNTRRCPVIHVGENWLTFGGPELSRVYKVGDVLELLTNDMLMAPVVITNVEYITDGEYARTTKFTVDANLQHLNVAQSYILLEIDTLFDWPLRCTTVSRTTLQPIFKERLQFTVGYPTVKIADVIRTTKMTQTITINGIMDPINRGTVLHLKGTTHADNHHVWRVAAQTYNKIANETYIHILPDPNKRVLRDSQGGSLEIEQTSFKDLVDVSMSDPSRGYDSDPFDIRFVGYDEPNSELVGEYVEKYTDPQDGQVKTRFQEAITFTFGGE